MKKRYKVIIGAALALVVIAYSAQSYFSSVEVSGEQIGLDDITDSFTSQGQIIPQQAVLLNAAATGTVLELPFKPGMAVKQGQELVSVAAANQTEIAIQKEQLRQQLATAEYQYRQMFGTAGQARQRAAVEAAQSAYDLAERQYQAALQVEREMAGVYTEAELAGLATAVKAAQQALTAAEAQGGVSADREYYQTLIKSTGLQLEALEEEQQNGVLVAPFDGVVWQLLAEEGAFMAKHQPLLKLYRQGQMKVEVSLPSDDALSLYVRQPATLNLGDGSQYEASISFISPVAQQELSTLGIMENRCIVELEAVNLPPELGAGYQVDVSFTRTLAENALSVAASSIVPLSGGSGVYVAENGKARLITVTTGVKSGGRVEVLSGLNAEDFVIDNPYDAGIKDGSRVKTIND